MPLVIMICGLIVMMFVNGMEALIVKVRSVLDWLSTARYQSPRKSGKNPFVSIAICTGLFESPERNHGAVVGVGNASMSMSRSAGPLRLYSSNSTVGLGWVMENRKKFVI